MSAAVPARRRLPPEAMWRMTAAYLIAALFAFPVLWTALSAFKPQEEASRSNPTLWPSHFSLENFAGLNSAGGSSMWGYVQNTLTVTLMTVGITTAVAVLTGYALSRFNFPGKRALGISVLAILLVPYPALMVSIFSVLVWLGLANSLLGLALLYSTFQLPFAVFMMKNSFDSVPPEIIEAAEIDGCSKLRVLWSMMVPLAWPGIVTVALFAFLAGWNEFFAALVMLSNNADFTLSIALVNAQFGALNTINWGALQAGVTVNMLPSIVLFMLLQRFYVAGLIEGSTK